MGITSVMRIRATDVLKNAMGNLPEKPLRQALRVLAIAAIAVFAGCWARSYFPTVRVDDDSESQSELAAAQNSAQPLLDALEKYHAENGLYPSSLNQLSPGYLASSAGLTAYRYSARHDDWVLQSDACLDRQKDDREKTLGHAILQPTNHTPYAVSRNQRDCLSGYREYQLQSPDFPPDVESRYEKRWAYYDSQPQYWTVGWCEQVRTKENTQELATNGVCRER